MEVLKLLSLLPEDLIEQLAIETSVNRYSKKLQGELVFKLLLHCILTHKENSLRTMESAYESVAFRALNLGQQTKPKAIRFNSISERLSVINATYFEKLYQCCVKIYSEVAGGAASKTVLFDSTIVSLSSSLLKVGYNIKGSNAAHVNQLKFTIGFSQIPTSATLFTEQKYTSENAALKEAMDACQPLKGKAIRIFDRGITSRKTHDELTIEKIPFISRIHHKSKFEEIGQNNLPQKTLTNTLEVFSDQWIYLFTTHDGRAKCPVRCIRGYKISNGEEIAFITNIPDIDTVTITELYRKRWDIEVFFKFLKQELNFSHLINRSENGIKVMLYATMIAAILLLTYKKKNNLAGYKIMKLRFMGELEKYIIRDVVLLCNGDTNIFDENFNKTPT